MKLLAVAQRGVGGEAVNARTALEAAMKRQGVTMADLEVDTKEMVFFTHSSETEARLLSQILVTVCGRVNLYQKTKQRRTLGAEMTKAQAAEVDVMWTAHRRQWAKEVDTLMIAYVHKQHLFPKDDDDHEQPEQAPWDQEKLKRVAMLMMGMPVVQAHKCLTSGG
jgi:hypothetical protein